MKEFLTSTTFPYWLIFGLVGASLVMMLMGIKKGNPRQYLAPVVGCMLGATLLELIIYWAIGNSAIWWCTSVEYGFFTKLLRLIPFVVFLAMQVAMIWYGKIFLEACIRKPFSMATTFWAILISYPVTLVVVIICNIFGVPDGALSIVSATLFLGIMAAGIFYALQRNITLVGKQQGIILTAFSTLCVLSLATGLILLFVALLQLFVQVLMVAGVVGVVYWTFLGDGTKMMNDEMARQSNAKTLYQDNDGHLHYTAGQAQRANDDIAKRNAK